MVWLVELGISHAERTTCPCTPTIGQGTQDNSLESVNFTTIREDFMLY